MHITGTTEYQHPQLHSTEGQYILDLQCNQRILYYFSDEPLPISQRMGVIHIQKTYRQYSQVVPT